MPSVRKFVKNHKYLFIGLLLFVVMIITFPSTDNIQSYSQDETIRTLPSIGCLFTIFIIFGMWLGERLNSLDEEEILVRALEIRVARKQQKEKLKKLESLS
jgi:hypothetical protein